MYMALSIENSVANSIQALNQILMDAQQMQINQAKKLIEVKVSTALSSSPTGVGENIDVVA
jgi:hypothetical protein